MNLSLRKKTNMIPDSDITISNINRLIGAFDREYGVYDETLKQLFDNADNADYIDVFCCVGLLDLIYSTGIQRFNKGGIYIVTKHINEYYEDIDAVKGAKEINFDIYRSLLEIDYSKVTFEHGKENNIPVFASKFLSFTNPRVYPIMDSIVKEAIGVGENIEYERFCIKLKQFRTEKINSLGKDYSLKDIDKFIWMWGKENKKIITL